MIINNIKTINSDGSYEENRLYITDNVIVNPDDYIDDGVRLDGEGLIAIPGLVDIHFHGAVGYDFCDADSDGLQKILDYEASVGVMAACPATMTYSEEILNCVIDNAVAFQNNGTGAELIGINLEGPFISPNKIAAQNPEYVQKGDSVMLQRLLKRAEGMIKLVDIAPEIAENMQLIDSFGGKVRISLAHTQADYETAKTAFKKGAKQLTHMFNAMNGINHREPGPILAAYEEGADVELICDGVHIHDSVIGMIFKLFDENKILLISDSMMATGLGDGEYNLGGQKVMASGNHCSLAEHPLVIAGSNTNLFDCMKHAVLSAGVPIYQAVKAATENPASAIGIDDKYGSLKNGCFGNVILMNEKMEIKYLITNGIIHKNNYQKGEKS